jgi:hypothetical protein
LTYQELQKKAMELSRDLHDIQVEYDADGDGCDDNYGDAEDAEDTEDAEDEAEDDAQVTEDAQVGEDEDQLDDFPKEIDLMDSTENP